MSTKSITKSININDKSQLDKLEKTLEKASRASNKSVVCCSQSNNVKLIKGEEVKKIFEMK